MKNTHARVMVLVNDRSSQCALQMYEVSLKYLLRLSSYRADTIVTDRRTDTRTDKQTQGEKQYVSRPLQGGDINILKYAILHLAFLEKLCR